MRVRKAIAKTRQAAENAVGSPWPPGGDPSGG